jgi:glycosyltransferase involved in cell wall biosynthesis
MIDVSVIIPTLNEEKYIGNLLTTLIEENNCSIEIFVCDAGSTDNTKQIVNDLKLDNVFLMHNERKFVSFAFNDTFPKTQGKYIALLGAHAKYPPHYFDFAIKYLNTECDVVGGPLIQLGKNSSGSAIANAMSSKFGVGGTEFRTERKKMFVDSVAFAVYKREIFNKIGLLDEELVRNQDDELHYRMNANNYKLLMVPEMECSYFVRDSLSKLFKQYYQYGYYKPLVFAKVKSGIRIRHLVPSLFVCYLLLLPIFLQFSTIFWAPLSLYLILAIAFGIKANASNKLIVILAFITLHISYGLGFLLGMPFYFKYNRNESN